MINSRNVDDLFSPVARLAKELKRRMAEQGYDLGFSSTYRDNESQNEIYKEGRTKPGTIKTGLRGGESMHNYRLAFDVFQNIEGQLYDDKFLNMAGKIGQELGLEWGGTWKGFIDRPHFQWTGGLSDNQIRNKKYPEDVQFPWEKVESEKIEEAVDDEMVTETEIEINGVLYTVNRIFKEDKNFVELQSLKQVPDLQVSYNEEKKLPVITFPKSQATTE